MIPKLRVPFEVANGRARVVEQGSNREIEQCAYAVLVTRPGDRDELPEFGSPSDLFKKAGTTSLDALIAAIEEWEPRITDATAEVAFQDAIETLRVAV